jgi:hypothetical protein
MKQHDHSFGPLNIFAPLASLLVELGGNITKFLDKPSVWFIAEVGGGAASRTGPCADVIKPTKNYFLDMAALAAEVEKLLVKHAENHEAALLKPQATSRASAETV